jgi:hypothetical protein
MPRRWTGPTRNVTGGARTLTDRTLVPAEEKNGPAGSAPNGDTFLDTGQAEGDGKIGTVSEGDSVNNARPSRHGIILPRLFLWNNRSIGNYISRRGLASLLRVPSM